MKVAIATAVAARELDEDEPLLLGALAAPGVTAQVAAWDDPTVDWERFDLVVVRSTWDYAERPQDFLAWAERVDALTTLRNPLPVLRWNLDKRYLVDLQAEGVPTVETTWLVPGDEVVLPDGEVVVKPAVSAGSRDTARYGPDDPRAADHAARLLAAGRTVMVQPYVASVDQRGEVAMVFVGGELSHAVTKGPILRRGAPATTGLFAAETITPTAPSDEEVEVADAVMRVVRRRFDPPAYARVDLVADDDGPRVLELELVEPSLFLAHGRGAAARLAAVLTA